MIMTQQTSTIGALLGAWQQAGTSSPVPASGPRFDLLLLEMTKPAQTAAGNGAEKAGTVAVSPKVQAAFQSLLESATQNSSDTVANMPLPQLPTPEQVDQVAQALSLDSRETEQLRSLVTLVIARVKAEAPTVLPAQADDEAEVAATSRAIPEANPGPQGGSPVTSPMLNSEPDTVSEPELPRKPSPQGEAQAQASAIVPLALVMQTQAPALVSTRTQGAEPSDARVSPIAGQAAAQTPAVQVTATSSPASDSTQSPAPSRAQAASIPAATSNLGAPSTPLAQAAVSQTAGSSQPQPQGEADESQGSSASRSPLSSQVQPESKRDLSVLNIATQNISENPSPLPQVAGQAKAQAASIPASASSPAAPEIVVQVPTAFDGVEFLPSDSEALSAPGTETVLDERGFVRGPQAPVIEPFSQAQAPAPAPAQTQQVLATPAAQSSSPIAASLPKGDSESGDPGFSTAPISGSQEDSDPAPARTAAFIPQLTTGSPVRAAVVQMAQPQDTLSRLIHQTLRDYSTRESVLKQTVDALKNLESEDGRLRIRLKPESLGQLDVVLSVENGKLSARLVASSMEVRDVIAADLRQFKQGLEQQGLQVQQLSVALRAETQSQGQPQQQPQQAWAQQSQPQTPQNPAPSQSSYEGYGEAPSQDQRFSALA